MTRLLPYALLVLPLLAGCGQADYAVKTYPIQGKVTLDGKPIPTAEIQLKDPSGELRTCIAEVKDGVVGGKATAGEKQLEVFAYRIAAGKLIPSGDGKTMESTVEQYLPAKYNTATTLTVTIEPNSNNTLNLELLSR